MIVHEPCVYRLQNTVEIPEKEDLLHLFGVVHDGIEVDENPEVPVEEGESRKSSNLCQEIEDA